MGVNGIKCNINKKVEKKTYFKMGKSVFKEMVAHCQVALPNEGCGLLSGLMDSGDTVWIVKNESPNPNRFYMSGKAIKHIYERIEQKGEKLSAIFHSHPSSPAIPSSHDIENNPYDELAYLIVSFYKENIEVGCFRMKNKKVIPLKLILIDD